MIKDIFISMHRNGPSTALTLALLVVSFALTMLTLTDSLSYKIQRDENAKLYSTSVDETYRLDVIHVNENEFKNVGTGINEIKKQLSSRTDTYVGAYYETAADFNELVGKKEYIERNKKLWQGTYEERYPDMAKVFFVDPKLFEFMDVDLSEAMFEPVNIDGKSYLPIYAGKYYEGVFEVGELLTLARTGDKYVFAGYIEPVKWFGFNPINEPPRTIDTYFWAPFCETDKTDSTTQLSTTKGIYVYSHCDRKALEQEVYAIADKYDIKIRISSVREIIDRWENEVKQQLGFYKKLVVTIIISSISSIIALLSLMVFLSKKEIGIKIAFGSSKKRIIASMQITLAIQILIALGISYLFNVYEVIQTENSDFVSIFQMTLNKIGLPVTAILGLVIMTVVGIVPLVLIKRYEPAELIKQS